MPDEFPAAYQVTTQTTTPVGAAQLTFRPVRYQASAAGLSLHVSPVGGAEWFGDFLGPSHGLTDWSRTPDPTHVLVVAGGLGYWVDVLDPSRYEVFEDFLVTSVHYSLDSRLLLLAGHSDICAIDASGRARWRATKLASDGFTEVRLGSSAVVVRGYQAASGCEVETTLDVRDGTVLSRNEC